MFNQIQQILLTKYEWNPESPLGAVMASSSKEGGGVDVNHIERLLNIKAVPNLEATNVENE